MKRIITAVMILVVSLVILTGCKKNPTVYYLNFKPEADSAWQKLAKKYEDTTGIEVNVVTAAEGKYEETLTSEMNKSSAPTLFQISGLVGYDVWKEYCLDLKDTAIYRELISDDYAIKADKSVYGIAYVYEGYGLITNKTLLKQAGYEFNEINSFEKLKEVAEDITSRKEELGFGAFSAAGLDGSSSWRFSGHLTNLPLYYEFTKDKVVTQPRTIKGTYIDNFKNMWDLYINNTNTVAPSALTNTTMDQSRAEFVNKKAVFYQNGTWEYGSINKALKDEEIGYLPIYMGIDDTKQGLCSGTENFWAVNKLADEDDIKATLDFLHWVATSNEGTSALADDMGFVAPFKKAKKTNNVLYKYIDETIANNKTNVAWLFTFTPNTETWRTGVVDALAGYSNNPTDASWDNVKKAMVDGWTKQYDLSHQK